LGIVVRSSTEHYITILHHFAI